MSVDLSVITTATGVLASSGSSDSDGTGIAWLLLLAGPLFYGVMYLRYRNADKRHKHESETRATMHDVRGTDHLNRSLKGLSNSKMKGANNRAVRGARNGLPGGLADGLPGKIGLGD